MSKFGRKRLYSTMTIFATVLMMPHSSLMVFAETTPTTLSTEELTELQETLLSTSPILNSSDALLGEATSGRDAVSTEDGSVAMAGASAEPDVEVTSDTTTSTPIEPSGEHILEATETTTTSENSSPASHAEERTSKKAGTSEKAKAKVKTAEGQSLEAEAGEVITGNYADGGVWSFDPSDGTLTFTGGTLLGRDRNKWQDYSDQIKKVNFATKVMGGYNLIGLFWNHSSLESLEDISNFDTTNVTSMATMFMGCSQLGSLDLSSFDTTSVTSMHSMFEGCSQLRTLDLSKFDTTSVTSMKSMFEGCSQLRTLNLSNFITTSVETMSNMFEGCSQMNMLDVSNFDTTSVRYMTEMFSGCSELRTLDLSSFITTSVEMMYSMFKGCTQLHRLDVSNFDTVNVTTMSYMFAYCSNLGSLNLNNFNTVSVEFMNNMFYDCINLKTLNIGGFKVRETGVNSNYMFYGSPLKKIIFGEDWLIDSQTSLLNQSWLVIEGGSITTLPDTASMILSHNQTGKTRAYYDATTYASDLTKRVTFNSRSGSEVESQLVLNGELVDLPAPPTKEGCTFKGWTTTKLGTELFDCSTPITEDLTLYAVWERNDGLPDGYYGDNDEGYWYLDKEGTLSLEGGTLTTTGSKDVPWKAYRDQVKKVVFATKVNAGKQISYLFSNYKNLEFFEQWENFDTRATENMMGLFADSKKLVTLDLRSFNTEKVTTMNSMFSSCTGLEAVDLSSFVTTNVTDMFSMFYVCERLKHLDVSHFTIPRSSSQMFTRTDFSSLTIGGDTLLSSEMMIPESKWLFENESKLEKEMTIDLIKKHNERQQTTTYYNEKYHRGVAFDSQGGTVIAPQIVVLGAKATAPTEPPTRKGYAFQGWSKSKTETTFFDFNTETIEKDLTLYARWGSVSGGYEDGTWELDDNGVLTLSGGKLTTNEAQDVPWYNYREDVTKVIFLSEVTAGENLVELFAGHSKLETIQDFNRLNLKETRDMSRLFQGCQRLDLLDLSGVATADEVTMTDLFDQAKVRQLVLDGHFALTDDTKLVTTYWHWMKTDGGLQTSLNTFSLIAKHQEPGEAYHYYNNNNFWMRGYGNNSGGVGIYDRDVQTMTLLGGVIDSNSYPIIYPMESVKKIIFGSKVTAGANLTGLFTNYPSITAIENLDKFDTSQAENMSEMFRGYQGAGTLDLSSFDTSNVTDMNQMFNDCQNLESLDLRSFDTTKVTDMRQMFRECRALEVLDVSQFSTPEVSNMSQMFYRCRVLKELDLSRFETANVTDMSWMFRECRALSKLDLSQFHTSQVSNMNGMFYYCDSLEALDVSQFDTAEVTDMAQMFFLCEKLTTLDVRSFTTSKVTTMAAMFSCMYALETLDLSKFDIGQVTNLSEMFYKGKNLKNLDISGFATPSQTVVVTGMFFEAGIQKLTLGKSWTLPSKDTIRLRNSNWFVVKDAAITPLATTNDLVKSHNADGQTRIYYAGDAYPFTEAARIVTFNSQGGSDVPAQIVEAGGLVQKPNDPKREGYKFFGWSTSKEEVAPFDFDETGIQENITLYATWSIAGEYADGGTWWLDPDGTLRIDGGTLNTTYSSRAPWDDHKKAIKKVILISEVTGGENLACLFRDHVNLQSIENLERLDTKAVTDMSFMFDKCSNLDTLDVSGFDTSSVLKMNAMFSNCSSLIVLDVSGFDTSSVRDMSHMFNECSNLYALDVSDFDTLSVTNMFSMFYGCSSLKMLDVSGFETSSVRDMSYMFYECSNLKTLDVSSFDTSTVIDMGYMFSSCSNLDILDVSGFNTSSVSDMGFMFSSCSNLEILDVGGFNTSSATKMSSMFAGCRKLTALDLSNYKTRVTVSTIVMFAGTPLTKLTISGSWMIPENTGLRNTTWYTVESGEICTLDDTAALIASHNGQAQTRTYYARDAYPIEPTSDHVIAFDTAGGSEVPAQIVKSGGKAMAPVTRRAGYAFVGWFVGDAETAYDFDRPVTASLTLTARWEESSSYTLTIPSEISLNDSRSLAVSATTASVTDSLRVSLKDAETETLGQKGQLLLTHETDDKQTHHVALDWLDKEGNLVLFVPANEKGQGKDRNRITFTLPEIKEPGNYHGVLTFETSFSNEEVEQ